MISALPRVAIYLAAAALGVAIGHPIGVVLAEIIRQTFFVRA